MFHQNLLLAKGTSFFGAPFDDAHLLPRYCHHNTNCSVPLFSVCHRRLSSLDLLLECWDGVLLNWNFTDTSVQHTHSSANWKIRQQLRIVIMSVSWPLHVFCTQWCLLKLGALSLQTRELLLPISGLFDTLDVSVWKTSRELWEVWW